MGYICSRATGQSCWQPQGGLTQSNPHLTNVTYDNYIIGAGDSLKIKLLNIRKVSGTIAIKTDGTIYLPLMRTLHVARHCYEELRYFLSDQFKTYLMSLSSTSDPSASA